MWTMRLCGKATSAASMTTCASSNRSQSLSNRAWKACARALPGVPSAAFRTAGPREFDNEVVIVRAQFVGGEYGFFEFGRAHPASAAQNGKPRSERGAVRRCVGQCLAQLGQRVVRPVFDVAEPGHGGLDARARGKAARTSAAARSASS